MRLLNELIESYWIDNVDSKCAYRGMDKNDLIFPLDPNFRPFNPVKDLILGFYDALDKLIENGILFNVVETHFGVTYKHDLRNIVRWSRRDINMTGIDFTSNYKEALEYADCWQGSQLKQNIKTISD